MEFLSKTKAKIDNAASTIENMAMLVVFSLAVAVIALLTALSRVAT